MAQNNPSGLILEKSLAADKVDDKKSLAPTYDGETPMTDTIIKELNRIGDEIINKVSALGSNVETLAGNAKDKAEDIKNVLEVEARENPLRSLAIALAAGAFLGFFMKR